MSKFIVALHLPNFTDTPSNTFSTGFVGMYVKNGWHKLMINDVELDAVLDRKLTDFQTTVPAAPIVSSDTLLQAIEKLSKTVQSITLTGDVIGTGVFQDGIFKIETQIQESLVDKHKVHVFDIPTLEWVINHNMEKNPAVTITDMEEKEVESDIIHDSNMQLRVIHSRPFSGKAFLN